MFALTKWYLDLVTDDGVAVIAHSARLRWGGVRVTYSALLRSRPELGAEESASVRRSDLPRRDGDLITWRCAPLALTGWWRREAAPITATLLDIEGGTIRWTVRVPRGRALVRWGGATHTGRGYAETLRLTIPPSRLPFRTLRWGRHVNHRHAAVWIAWEGRSTQRWCWLDGTARPAARVAESGVDLGDGTEVRFLESRPLLDRTPAARLASLLPRLSQRLADEVGRMRERRILSRSVLVAGAEQEADRGWTIHEQVTW